MATFIVRVQLRKDRLEDYIYIKDELAKLGFTKKILSDKGSYILPLGNYLLKSTESMTKILKSVHMIVKTVDKKAEILVTEVKESAWTGLKKA